MDDHQPIKYFPRMEIRFLQFLSEKCLTHAEVNVVLEMIAMSDIRNIIEPSDSLSRYMQGRFEVSKRLMNRYLQKIRELDLFRSVDGNPNAFRGIPFLYNRLRFLNSLWEYGEVNTMAGWVLGQEFFDWQTNGDASKTLGSPSYARLTNVRGLKSEDMISKADHDKEMNRLTLEHRKEFDMVNRAFAEVIEEHRRKNDEALERQRSEMEKLTSDFKQSLYDAISELKKHDPMAAETLKKRHLEIVRD